jgi:hypothetical protein
MIVSFVPRAIGEQELLFMATWTRIIEKFKPHTISYQQWQRDLMEAERSPIASAGAISSPSVLTLSGSTPSGCGALELVANLEVALFILDSLKHNHCCLRFFVEFFLIHTLVKLS